MLNDEVDSGNKTLSVKASNNETNDFVLKKQAIKELCELANTLENKVKYLITYAEACVEIADTVMDTARQQKEYKNAVDALMQVAPAERRDEYEHINLIECLYSLLCTYDNSEEICEESTEKQREEEEKIREELFRETQRLEKQYLAPDNIQKCYMALTYIERADEMLSGADEQDLAFERGIQYLEEFILSSGNTGAHNYYRLGDAYALYAENTFDPCKKQELLEKGKEALEISYQNEKSAHTLKYLQEVTLALQNSGYYKE